MTRVTNNKPKEKVNIEETRLMSLVITSSVYLVETAASLEIVNLSMPTSDPIQSVKSLSKKKPTFIVDRY